MSASIQVSYLYKHIINKTHLKSKQL